MPIDPTPTVKARLHSPLQPMHGVTLVELVVTLAIFAILVSLGTPSFVRMIAADRMAHQTNELVMALNSAKSEAITRGTPVTLRARDDANPTLFNRGWTVFTDGDSDGAAASPVTPADGTVLRVTDATSGNTTIIRSTRTGTSPTFTYPAATTALSTRQFVTFNARGGLATGGPAFFRVCDTSNRTIPGRIILINTVGKIAIESTTEDCTT